MNPNISPFRGTTRHRLDQRHHDTDGVIDEKPSQKSNKCDRNEKILEPNLSRCLSPVYRCSDDILYLIFEFCLKQSFHWGLKEALVVSHICRRWREIARSVPRLWTVIDASLSMDLSHLKSKRDISRLLSKNSPLSVTIHIPPIDEEDEVLNLYKMLKFMSIIDIQEIPVISKLQFNFDSGLFASLLGSQCDNQPEFGKFGGTIDIFSLYYTGMEEWSYPINLNDILKAYPTPRKLVTSGFFDVNVDATSPLLGVRSLELRDTVSHSAFQHLGAFRDIEELIMVNVSIDVDSHQSSSSLSLPNLRILTSLQFERLPWMVLDTPKLEKIIYDDKNMTVDFRDFLSKNPSLRQLSIGPAFGRSTFTKIAESLPLLEALELGMESRSSRSPFLWFCEWEKIHSLESIPFPNLQRLLLLYNASDGVTPEMFDKFMTERCASGQSVLQSLVFKSLTIIGHRGGIDDVPWKDGIWTRRASKNVYMPPIWKTLEWDSTKWVGGAIQYDMTWSAFL